MLDKIEEKILQRIDADREQIISFAEDIAAHPEPGFEEIRTSQKAAQFLKNLGYEVTEHLVRTGVRGDKRSQTVRTSQSSGNWMRSDASHIQWQILLPAWHMPADITHRWQQ